jgi:WD40 repeat protein
VSSAEYLVSSAGRHKLGLGIAIAVLLVILVGGILWLNSRTGHTAPTFHKVRLSQLTNTGKATVATISPDGKYVVHVVSDGTQSSLWVRQVATSSNVQIVPPAESSYVGMTFSPDGNYVYYVVYEKTMPLGIVYQIPVLGGTPRKIIQDVDTPITFSGDGKRFAWIRNYPQSGETALFVANSDGSGEQKIASRQRPNRFLTGTPVGPSWSPLGGLIACPVAGHENNIDVAWLVAIDVDSRTERQLTSHRWAGLQRVVWIPQGTGVILTAQELLFGPNQVWHLGYPGGETE